ncbi:MAG: malto-oligosyltrehalose trehalohydrolase [Herpetosiphon sp.]
MIQEWQPGFGATYLGGERCNFRVWAPNAKGVVVHIDGPADRTLTLASTERGYFEVQVDGVTPGTRYYFRLDDGAERPDPASRSQPDGVHKASEVVDRHYDWQDNGWVNPALDEYIIYELHVGTFTPEGTFDAVIPHLDGLQQLGITAIELMPIAQFPGNRNWGYDGVYPYAVHASYGGPAALKRLVQACHERGLAVVLDVVYNHLGPEGNYLRDFGPFFTERYGTPWGAAINFDGAYSDEVRRFFIDNALLWVAEFHVDALRLDATHAMLDLSAWTFLEELTAVVHDFAGRHGRQVYLIAENDRNDARVVTPTAAGGYGLDGQWSDEFHHTLHTLLTGERAGYYEDFGFFQQFVKAYREGFVYSGEYAPARQRRHGTSSLHLPATGFVICTQNHDQVGNRMLGERPSQLVDFASLKLLAGALLLSPYLPLLFMGEEYGETAPFLYFVSHGDADVIAAVQRGRHDEFAAFAWQGEAPDPQSEATFERSRLNHALAQSGKHRVMLELYMTLLAWRKHLKAWRILTKEHMVVADFEDQQSLVVDYAGPQHGACVLMNLGEQSADLRLPVSTGRWHKAVASADDRWQESARGAGSRNGKDVGSAQEPDGTAGMHVQLPGRSFALYVQQEQ